MAAEWHDPSNPAQVYWFSCSPVLYFSFLGKHIQLHKLKVISPILSLTLWIQRPFFTRVQPASSRPSAAVRVAPTDASQLPQWLFGFAGLIPDGFGSRVIRLSPKGQRACQVSPHINVVLLTPWADSTARRRGREKHWSGVVGGMGGWRGTCIVSMLNKV